MKKYDLHTHTRYSKCSNNDPKKIIAAAKRKGLTGIAITDHNTIKGALLVKQLNKDKNFEVIVGEEVRTDIGEVLIYYVKEEIRPGKFEEVIKQARKQGAICVLAHPYNILSEKIAAFFKRGRKTIKKKHFHKLKLLDGIEGFNARCLLKKENILAQKLAKKFKKTAIAGSDAHFLSEYANAYVEFDDKYTLKQAILKNKLNIKIRNMNPFINRFKSFLRLILK